MAVSRDTLLYMYETMVNIRGLEERIIEEVSKGNITGAGHSYVGQEAVATGVCANLGIEDYVASSHRGHGHTVAKGVSIKGIMAELFGKATGTNKGKGGSMHLADMSQGMLGTNGIVGNSISFITGAGLSAKIRGTDNVAVCFFGDGASNQGSFHESLNLAAVWKLPVLYVCENNLYAESTPAEYAVAVRDIAQRASSYNIPGVIVDGQDVFEVYDAARQAIDRARAGQGPTLLECKTYRYHGHYWADDHLRYRSQEEVDYYKSQDCIDRFKARVLDEDLLREEDIEAIDQNMVTIMEEAAEFALNSPVPDLSELYTDVYMS